YAYGLGFHAYLAERYGDEKFAALAEATARRIPYTASLAFKKIYGRSLGTLWEEYEQSLVDATPRSGPLKDVERLTHTGFVVSAPRFDRWVCATCAPEIFYSTRTPHQFPALNRLRLDGSPPQRVTTRYFGSTTAADKWTIYFDQLEVRRNTGLYSDLYAFD